jgi:[ribosomal protein S18]-alanine N-acetyltransferase
MIVGQASPEQAPELAAVHALAFDPPWTAADIGALMSSPGAFALAARAPIGLAGFILGRVAADEAEVLTLAVHPDCRRRGVATKLLGGAVGVARARGARSLFLEVSADNSAAIALYSGAGFDRVGERKGYYVRAEGSAPALVMRLLA